MQKFFEIVLKYNKILIGIILLITVLLGISLKNLTINADILSYLPEDDPVARTFNYIGKEYGGNSLAMVALETDNVFNRETIQHVSELTTKYSEIDGVNYVISLTNAIDIRKNKDGIEIGKLIDKNKLPTTKAELKKIKDYTLSKEMYRGRLISEDGSSTIIICRLDADYNRIAVAREIKKATHAVKLNEKIFYGGLPFQMMDMTELIVNDMVYLVPLILLLICLSLFISFRSLRGVFLPLVSVTISTIWTLGVMILLNIPLTMISNIIPIILIAVGSAYSIHVISKLREQEKSENRDIDDRQAMIDSLSAVGKPVFLSAFTTMAGFIAFIFGSYLSNIREFGMFVSLGVFFSLVMALVLVPAILSIFPMKKRAGKKKTAPSTLNRFDLRMDSIGSFTIKHKKAIIAAGIIIIVICAIGFPRIERKVDMLDYFQKGTSIRMTEEFLEKKFGGSIPLQILVKGDIQDPEVLRAMDKMEDYVDGLKNASNTQSVVDLIKEMNRVIGEGKKIPDSTEKVSNLWFLLEGEDIMSQLVNDDKTEAIIQATISNFKSDEIKAMVEGINKFSKTIKGPDVSFQVSGIPPVYMALDTSILRSQIQSVIFALVLVFLTLTLLFRSLYGGLIGIVPIVFTIFVVFGFMSYAGIPLDMATVMVGSISIGIGIDYSIHFASRFKLEFEKNTSILEALDITLETTGRAIIINVITVMLGFLVLIMSEIVPIERFGVLVAITMAASGIGAITLLPAIIILTKAGFIGDWRKIKKLILNNKKL